MSDITASTALRDFIAAKLSTAGGSFMWATLHSTAQVDGTVTPATIYEATGLNELPTANGYTAQGKTCGTISEVDGVLDTPDVVWTTAEGESLTAKSACIWVNDANTIIGAALVSLEDNEQTASNGGAMTFSITNPIIIPTPV